MGTVMRSERIVYVGTYTSGHRGEGIYRLPFNGRTGMLGPAELAVRTDNPSFLALDPRGAFLYAVGETDRTDGRPGGSVSSYTRDASTGSLTPLSRVTSAGSGPCHLAVDRNGRFLLVANYASGSIATIPVSRDGRLGNPADTRQHAGSNAGPDRPKEPRAHSMTLDPDNRYAFAADLGLDCVMVYAFDQDKGTLTDRPPVHVAEGSGPRHFAFHPSGRFAYLVNELSSTVTAFSYEREEGRLRQIQTINALPEGFADASAAADIHVSPSGRFLYSSNRGHDSIAVFSVSMETGMLEARTHVPTGGKTPRNFAIDPTGAFLLAANQESGTIVTFRLDPDTGAPRPTGNQARLPAPSCVLFSAGDSG